MYAGFYAFTNEEVTNHSVIVCCNNNIYIYSIHILFVTSYVV